MRVRLLVLTFLVLAVSLANAGEHVALRVSPRVAFAPADLNVLATIEANAQNRTVEIAAESEDFYRSTEVPLDGERAPKSTFVQFRGLPGGSYVVRVIVRGSLGQQLGVSNTAVNIVHRE